MIDNKRLWQDVWKYNCSLLVVAIRLYGTAQLQVELATRVHAWHHEKISPRPVTCLRGPRLHVACNTHVTCNLTRGHACIRVEQFTRVAYTYTY